MYKQFNDSVKIKRTFCYFNNFYRPLSILRLLSINVLFVYFLQKVSESIDLIKFTSLSRNVLTRPLLWWTPISCSSRSWPIQCISVHASGRVNVLLTGAWAHVKHLHQHVTKLPYIKHIFTKHHFMLHLVNSCPTRGFTFVPSFYLSWLLDIHLPLFAPIITLFRF